MAEKGHSKRKDKNRVVLRKGEIERPNGTYQYRWTDKTGARRSIYAKTLDELRVKEEDILKDQLDGVKPEARTMTVNDVYNTWKELKRGLKDNTFCNYTYLFKTFVQDNLGKKRISTLKKSDVKRFYNYLADERGLQASTIDGVHTVLHQVLALAVDDCLLRNNVADNVLKELKQSHIFKTEKRRALTVKEQDLFLNFLKKNHTYNHWYPIFAVMLGTGLRVGEVTGLRWCDIDLENSVINVTHTLVYYNHAENGCYFNVHSPKTEAGKRSVPMLDFVKKAFIDGRSYQEAVDIKCISEIDGYTDFIFVNRFGNVQHQGTLNKAIKRIIRDCNDEVLLRGEKNPVLLPNFSCHTLRHTFTTRMVEAGVDVKVVQDALGHADISTTLGIYTDVTNEHKKKEFKELDEFIKGSSGLTA